MDQLELTPSLDSKTMNQRTEASTNSPSPVPEVIKPPEKLIITFENPASEVRPSYVLFGIAAVYS